MTRLVSSSSSFFFFGFGFLCTLGRCFRVGLEAAQIVVQLADVLVHRLVRLHRKRHLLVPEIDQALESSLKKKNEKKEGFVCVRRPAMWKRKKEIDLDGTELLAAGGGVHGLHFSQERATRLRQRLVILCRAEQKKK